MTSKLTQGITPCFIDCTGPVVKGREAVKSCLGVGKVDYKQKQY